MTPFDGFEWQMKFDGEAHEFTASFKKRTSGDIEILKTFKTSIGCFSRELAALNIDMKRPNNAIDLGCTLFDGISFDIRLYNGGDMVSCVVYDFEHWKLAFRDYPEIRELFEWGKLHLDKVVLA